jgi:hypothetical protein
MEPEEDAADDRSSAGWLRALRRAIDNLVQINRNLESLRRENRRLRQQIIELAQLVHYQAGQIQQIDHRIKDAVEAQVLRELARRTGQPTEGSVGRTQPVSEPDLDDVE